MADKSSIQAEAVSKIPSFGKPTHYDYGFTGSKDVTSIVCYGARATAVMYNPEGNGTFAGNHIRGICHGSLAGYTGWEQSTSSPRRLRNSLELIITYPITHHHQPAMYKPVPYLTEERVFQFYNWLVNHSPWKSAFLPTTPEQLLESLRDPQKGYLLVDPYQRKGMVLGALIASRTLSEKGLDGASLMFSLVDRGVSFESALIAAYSIARKRVGNHIVLQMSYQRQGAHSALDIGQMYRKCLWRFFTSNPSLPELVVDVLSVPFNNRSINSYAYNGMYGSGGVFALFRDESKGPVEDSGLQVVYGEFNKKVPIKTVSKGWEVVHTMPAGYEYDEEKLLDELASSLIKWEAEIREDYYLSPEGIVLKVKGESK